MTGDPLELRIPSSLATGLRNLAVVGGLTLLLGLYLAPQRVWPNLLLAGYLLIGLGLAGLFFVALQYVSGAGWSVALRRVPEALSMLLIPGALVLALVFLGKPSLYPWFGMAWEDPEGVLWFKRAWLSRPVFLSRAAVYIVAWLVFAYGIVHTSRRQDREGGVDLTRKNARLSAAFIVVFGVTFCLASFDWIMSLEPSWYSTIFGVYNFAGLFSGGLAAIIVLLVWLQRLGALNHTVTDQHLLDLGRLLFAFCTFWAYIWFSQYMLIWYANIPEETAYFIPRVRGTWGALLVLNLLLNWAVPFLALLPRWTKQTPGILVKIAGVVLLGRWLDLYLMIFPPLIGARPAVGVWEVAAVIGALALGLRVFFFALRQAPLIPIGDPYLRESLHYHQ